MSKNWGRTPVTNADKRSATMSRYLVEVDGGTEERIDRRPLGRVERFVDPDGGVVSLQLYSDGDPQRHASEIRRRAELHRKGFVEYAKCPIKHGTRNSSPIATKDFAKLPQSLATECRHDPKVMERRDGDLYAGRSCPHIEWLVSERRKKAADAYKKRNAIAVAKEQALAERREIEMLDLAKRRRELDVDNAKPQRAAKPKEASE